MKKVFVLALAAALSLTSCVSKQKYVELETLQNTTADKLSNAKMELAAALAAKDAQAQQLAELKADKNNLAKQVGDLTAMSATNAQNMEKTLESINEKELSITRLQDAMNRKDSVTFALVTSLKGALGDMNDEDVQISVEKGVVYVNLSDKLMFRPGSDYVSKDAKNVLGKVAKIMNAKPGLEILVEGHTDSIPLSGRGLVKDNWDLSVMRATSVVKRLTSNTNLDPTQLIAAGRSEFVPISSNETSEGRGENRRIEMILSPNLDDLFKLLEE